MPPFTSFPVVKGLKEKPEALLLINDRLYVALTGGSLGIYFFTPPPSPYTDNGKGKGRVKELAPPTVKLMTTKKAFSRRPIDQLGWLEETNELVVLSDGTITLWDLPNLKTPTVLTNARNAQTFAIQNHLRAPAADSWVTTLVIGCRKKVVVMSWSNGRPEPTRDLALPHTPRLILFAKPNTIDRVHLHCSATSSYVLKIPLSGKPLTYVEPAPLPETSAAASGQPPASGSTGVTGALSGLGGYVGKGLGALGRASSALIGATARDGVVFVKDGQGLVIDEEGKIAAGAQSIEWPSPPEDLAFADPYLVSLSPVEGQDTQLAMPCLQFRLGQNVMQTWTIPPVTANSPAAATHPPPSSITLLTAVSSRKTSTTSEPRFMAVFASTPVDKVQLQSTGSTVWALEMSGVDVQLDELALEGRFAEALSLLDVVSVDDSPSRRHTLRSLDALTKFASHRWDGALDTWIDLDVNPAKIVALYPADTVSGRLHRDTDEWVELFGGPANGRLPAVREENKPKSEAAGVLRGLAHLGLSKKGSSEKLREDSASIRSGQTSIEEPEDNLVPDVYPPAALESLARYLSDRRQKIAGAMAALKQRLPDETAIQSAEETFAIPSTAIDQLDPEQLLRVSQVVYTALLKVYLVIRPVLVGSLCRIENWIDVDEVEPLLRAKGRFSDLVDLYQGKKMHGKALDLLREMAAKEDDKLDKLPPTIRYLQKLGPSHMQTIFDQSEWLFKEDAKMALQVFTADEPEVEALPRTEVLAFLENRDRNACIGYLEHLIEDLGEAGPDFHDKLAELYLTGARKSVQSAQGHSTSPDMPPEYAKLLQFLRTSSQYRPERLFGKLRQQDIPLARALLLGRLGNHEAALQIYVHRLEAFQEAEDYCTRVYSEAPDPKGIFLTLLRIYLRPTDGAKPRIDQAISLIATHGTRIEVLETMALLPPLVTMQDVQGFFLKTLRLQHAQRNESRVTTGLLKTRKEQVERTDMTLQQKRVRITDTRICPQCYKRLGQSVIAVHAPRGEVTHYQCKDAFSRKLASSRI